MKNYVWVDSIHNGKCCENCDQCCEKKKVGGLGFMDSMEVTKVLLSKWVLHAFELGDSNIQEFVRFKPRGFQLHKGGKWALDFEWCV